MRVRSEAHKGANDKPTRPLDRVVSFLPANLEFRSRERRQPEQFDEPRCSRRILQAMKQIDDVVVEIVVDLGIATLFPQQHRRSAAERLDVHAMRGEVRDDPWSQPPLAAMPAQNRARRCNSVHVGTAWQYGPLASSSSTSAWQGWSSAHQQARFLPRSCRSCSDV